MAPAAVVGINRREAPASVANPRRLPVVVADDIQKQRAADVKAGRGSRRIGSALLRFRNAALYEFCGYP